MNKSDDCGRHFGPRTSGADLCINTLDRSPFVLQMPVVVCSSSSSSSALSSLLFSMKQFFFSFGVMINSCAHSLVHLGDSLKKNRVTVSWWAILFVLSFLLFFFILSLLSRIYMNALLFQLLLSTTKRPILLLLLFSSSSSSLRWDETRLFAIVYRPLEWHTLHCFYFFFFFIVGGFQFLLL